MIEDLTTLPKIQDLEIPSTRDRKIFFDPDRDFTQADVLKTLEFLNSGDNRHVSSGDLISVLALCTLTPDGSQKIASSKLGQHVERYKDLPMRVDFLEQKLVLKMMGVGKSDDYQISKQDLHLYLASRGSSLSSRELITNFLIVKLLSPNTLSEEIVEHSTPRMISSLNEPSLQGNLAQLTKIYSLASLRLILTPQKFSQLAKDTERLIGVARDLLEATRKISLDFGGNIEIPSFSFSLAVLTADEAYIEDGKIILRSDRSVHTKTQASPIERSIS